MIPFYVYALLLTYTKCINLFRLCFQRSVTITLKILAVVSASTHFSTWQTVLIADAVSFLTTAFTVTASEL